MTALELQKRKNWALEVLQSCNSEDAIAHMEVQNILNKWR